MVVSDEKFVIPACIERESSKLIGGPERAVYA